MDALKHNRFDVARMTLQTLINTYPDSEFIARAKLAIADSWYDEGGTAALSQAEAEYKDFETFFPNMPEAAEAQFKIANIHYQQMEKPDRDFTHAMRAEDEYRQMIMQYPDSKLVPEAKQRLLEVQEVLGQREYNIGRFYFMRQSYPAAIARLRSLIDKYPLYSQIDEGLYLLGQSYEGEVTMLRARNMNETQKARLIAEFTTKATEAYSRIITRYPLMDRAESAKQRLEALHQPVPKPTKAAVALNKKEEESRRETGMFGRLVGNFNKHPDVAQATKIGDPTLVDPTPVSASEVVQQATKAMIGSPAPSANNKVSVETVGTGAPPVGESTPRSDAPPADNSATGSSLPASAAETANPAAAPGSTGNSAEQTSSAGELVPNVPADANELKPNVAPDASDTLPPPQQVNEISNPVQGGQAGATGNQTTKATASAQSKEEADDTEISSSKRKKKKGLRKIVPF
jgi:outer membrane protein assembly factor BamD